jgi:uncharacterized protein
VNYVVSTGWLAACAVVAAIGGCSSAGTRVFGLESAAPAARVSAYGGPVLRVDSLSVPAAWDRIEILSRAAGGSLRIADFDHWSAPLPRIARETLSADLEQRLPPDSVVYPRLTKPGGALGISVDILEFNVAATEVSARVSWLLVPGAAPGPQGAKRSVALLRIPVTSTQDPAAIAQAWSGLLSQLADRIAADVAGFATP